MQNSEAQTDEQLKAEIQPLLSLLDDTDTTVTTAVQNKLLSYGHRVVPFLNEVLQREIELTRDDENPVVINARACVRALQTGALSKLFSQIIDAHLDEVDVNLDQASYLLSSFGFPDIDETDYYAKLDAIALRVHSIFVQMKNASDLTLLMSLNTVFFEEEDFRGATKNYYAPENSYISQLLSSKRGIPISISVAYMMVADRVGIELHGIGMPLHFLVYHPGLNVFIDTFNHGAFISRSDCEQFIRQSGFAYSEKMLSKSSNIDICVRMMRNLIYAHSKYNQKWEAETLQETLDEILRLTDDKHQSGSSSGGL